MNFLLILLSLYLIASLSFGATLIYLQDKSYTLKETLSNIIYCIIVIPLTFWALLIYLSIFYGFLGIVVLADKMSVDENK